MNYPLVDVWQGNEVQLEWRGATAENGIPFNLAGATAVLLVKARLTDPDSGAILTETTENGGIQIEDANNGILIATIKAEESEAIQAAANGCPRRSYYCQFAVKLSTGQIVRSAVFILRFNQGVIAAMT